MPPVRPMLAKAVHDVPRAPGLLYEPKWDGFRCIVFRDGDEVELGSRNDRPLTRYFPELVELLAAALPPRCVVDGEIVRGHRRRASTSTRCRTALHPAASRVRKLAAETPASFVAFDLLALGDTDLTERALPASGAHARKHPEHRGRRAAAGAPHAVDRGPGRSAEDWFTRFEGAGFDGVMAKPG